MNESNRASNIMLMFIAAIAVPFYLVIYPCQLIRRAVKAALA